MEKYNKELINNYINGKNLEGYSIEELENDKQFMMLVIRLTNDKDFYNLCSDKVKKDYDFVRFIIKKFENDIDFVCNVADYYLEDVEDELSRTELLIIMTDITNKKRKQKHHQYQVVRDTIFTAKKVQIEMAKIQSNDENTSKEIGMGFLLIFDSYNSSRIVLDFYARNIIKSIFDEYDIDLENMLHQQFKAPEQLDKIGINNYLLNFIGFYDSMLASYLSAHIELLSELSNKIKIIQNNWGKYETKNERSKYNMLFEKVHEYMEEKGYEGMFDETTLLYYIGKKLGIAERIAKYDYINTDIADEIMDEIDEDFINDTLKVSFMDRVHLNNVKKIMASIIFSNHYEEPSEFSNEDNKGKILKLHFRNKLD